MITHCTFKPENVVRFTGLDDMFHCPICHEMQTAGLPHTDTSQLSDFDLKGCNNEEKDE